MTPLGAAAERPSSHMFVANLLPEDVLVQLQPTVFEGSGWTLEFDSGLTFPMEKDERPRMVSTRAVPGAYASDSAAWDVGVLETGSCGAVNTGGGRVKVRKTDLVEVPGGVLRVPTLLMAPRPFREGLDLTFGLPSAGRVAIRIYDVAGREVRRMDLGERPAGLVRGRWDGMTNNGADAPPGLYLVRAWIGNTQLGGRVIRVR